MRFPSCRLLVLASLAVLPAAVAAQAPVSAHAPAQQALSTLVGSLSPGETIELSANSAAAMAAARKTVVVGRGETLDSVIRRSMGEQPFKEAYIRGILVELNPKAFPGGPTSRLAPGTSLMVPTTDDLLRPLLAHSAAATATPTAAGAAPRPPGPAAAAPPPTGPDRRGWVRFP